MRVSVKHHSNMSFDAITDSGHKIAIDASPDVGGENRGARPMELMLTGLGGCSAIDVLLILKKSRQDVSDCKIDIDAERADSIPAVFTKIHMHYIVSGKSLSHDRVKRAISLSAEKYCSATRMLEASAMITHDFEIINE